MRFGLFCVSLVCRFHVGMGQPMTLAPTNSWTPLRNSFGIAWTRLEYLGISWDAFWVNSAVHLDPSWDSIWVRSGVDCWVSFGSILESILGSIWIYSGVHLDLFWNQFWGQFWINFGLKFEFILESIRDQFGSILGSICNRFWILEVSWQLPPATKVMKVVAKYVSGSGVVRTFCAWCCRRVSVLIWYYFLNFSIIKPLI